MTSFKIKYFRDTIISCNAILTYNRRNRIYNNREGIIIRGRLGSRFAFVFDSPVNIKDEEVYSILLSEQDEIILIPKK